MQGDENRVCYRAEPEVVFLCGTLPFRAAGDGLVLETIGIMFIFHMQYLLP